MLFRSEIVLVDYKSLSKEELIPGGLAEGMEPEDFDQDQLDKGTEVEMEHTESMEVAQEIAMDHLVEMPEDYYDRLEAMEEQAKKEGKFVETSSVMSEISLFLKENPNPSASQVHAWAEENGIDKHALEEVIYQLATKSVLTSSFISTCRPGTMKDVL